MKLKVTYTYRKLALDQCIWIRTRCLQESNHCNCFRLVNYSRSLHTLGREQLMQTAVYKRNSGTAIKPSCPGVNKMGTNRLPSSESRSRGNQLRTASSAQRSLTLGFRRPWNYRRVMQQMRSVRESAIPSQLHIEVGLSEPIRQR